MSVAGGVAEGPTASGAEHGARLKENALNLGSSVIIGLASAAPTASIALTLAAIVAATGYASPIEVILCAVPMLGIAVAYRRLNMWHVNCGGTYMWAGRAISPYFGFMVGWVIILAYFIGAMSIVLPIGTYAVQLFHNSYQNSAIAQAIIDTVALAFITFIAYIGIRATARLQWLLIAIEYAGILLLAGFALHAVFSGKASAASFHGSWFSFSTLGGWGGFISGALIAVYMYSGWDTSILVNEETENSRTNPGTAVILSVLGLAVLFAFFIFAFQGALSSKALQGHGENALFVIGGIYAGSWLAKWVILAVMLSAVGSVLACIVSGARVTFAMAYDRVLPPLFARTHRDHKTPYMATFLGSAIALAALWAYSAGSSGVQDLFDTLVSLVGLLFALFYAATGIAMAVYYRNLSLRTARNAVEFMILPAGSAIFLLYVSWKSIPGLGGWGGKNMIYLYVLLGIGLLVMVYSKLRVRSAFFDLPREAHDGSLGAEVVETAGAN